MSDRETPPDDSDNEPTAPIPASGSTPDSGAVPGPDPAAGTSWPPPSRADWQPADHEPTLPQPPWGGQQPAAQPPSPAGDLPPSAPSTWEYVPVTPEPPRADRSRLPGWTWPLISALALVVGVAGGVLGGALVADNDDDPVSGGPGGTLTVERRTAPPLPADNGSVAAVSAKVLPSTVQVIAEYEGKDQGATGSGFVYDEQGHVITNNHVVADAAENDGPIDVIDHDGRHHEATVVGRSPVYDIAVLKVSDAADLPPAAIGASSQMRVGETVVAFGSPLGLSATVTSGIISAVNRPVTTGDDDSAASYINAVQTDAAINPGNSGGPLVNLQGQVIGVNSAIASLGSLSADEGGNIGVGFAIPIEQAEVTATQILRTGEAKYPVIGANVRGTEKLTGARVESIGDGTPASRSGLEVGDLITKVDGKPVTGSIDVVVAVRTHQPGESVTLTVERDGKTLTIEVGLEAKVG